jgi:hypothetical protein
MAVRVRISNGDEFIVYESVENLSRSFREALEDNRLLEVKNGDGRIRIVNPHQVVYFEEVPPDQEDSREEEAPQVLRG